MSDRDWHVIPLTANEITRGSGGTWRAIAGTWLAIGKVDGEVHTMRFGGGRGWDRRRYRDVIDAAPPLVGASA